MKQRCVQFLIYFEHVCLFCSVIGHILPYVHKMPKNEHVKMSSTQHDRNEYRLFPATIICFQVSLDASQHLNDFMG